MVGVQQINVIDLRRESNDGAIFALAKAKRESVPRLNTSDGEYLSRGRYSRHPDKSKKPRKRFFFFICILLYYLSEK